MKIFLSQLELLRPVIHSRFAIVRLPVIVVVIAALSCMYHAGYDSAEFA